MIHQVWQYLLAQLHGNQFFAGATLTGIILAILNYTRGYAVGAWKFLWKRLTVSVKIHSEDPIYNPLMMWLNKHRFDLLAQHYRLKTIIEDGSDEYYDPLADGPVGASAPSVNTIFGPDYGNYYFKYAGKWIRVNVIHEDKTMAGGKDGAQTRDFITMRYMGLSKKVMNKVIEGALNEYYELRNSKLSIFQSQSYGWREAGTIDRYVEGSEHIILEDGVMETIESEVREFFESKKKYKSLGVPWRRGFMLQGPPGTGKTSLCRHLASKFKMNIYVVAPSTYTSEHLSSMLHQVRPHSIVLFEDIDRSTAMDKRGKKNKDENDNSLESSLSDMIRGNIGVLLNAIDGITPAEGILIVMTSNETKELDPALTRPGRIDRIFHLDRCSKAQAIKIFRKFYPGASAAAEMGFSSHIVDRQYSPAELQEKFLREPNPEAFASLRVVDNLL